MKTSTNYLDKSILINRYRKADFVPSMDSLLEFRNSTIVEIVNQTTRRLYTRVKSKNGYEWDVMTNRLDTLDD